MADRFVTVPDSLELPAAVLVPIARLSDAGTAGRAVLDAETAADGRTALGLGGASVLNVGTGADDVKAGNYQPAAANISDATAAGRGLLTAADAAAQRAALGVAPSLDIGQTVAARLRYKTGSVAVGIAGDSTGNASNEWLDTWATAVGVADPTLRVEIPHWNDTTHAYDAPTVVQAGGSDYIVRVKDTFTRTAADLYGSLPDVAGTAWIGDSALAAGDYSLNGTAAVSTSDAGATRGVTLADSGVVGNATMTINGVLTSVPVGGVAHAYSFYLAHASISNHLFATLSVSAGGTTTWTLFKRIAGAATSLGSVATPYPANVAGQSYLLTFSRVGTTVTATIGAATITGTITEGDVAVLGTRAGFTSTLTPGATINDFELSVAETTSRVLTIYNASISGSVLTAQQAYLAAMYPVPLDLLIVSSGHNYGTNTPAQYEAALDVFLAAFRAVQPAAGILVSSQNPQKSPQTGITAHLARLAILRSYAARHGCGYLPALEAFWAQANHGAALIQSDGAHPTTGAGSGSELWRDTMTAYMAAI